jgi:hypothetical protein
MKYKMGKYKGKELRKSSIETYSHRNAIKSKAVYVEDYYSEELRRPEFVEINQQSVLFEDIDKINKPFVSLEGIGENNY